MITGRSKIPLLWMIGLALPVAVFAYVEKCSGTALTFTLKKYTSDPALIAFVGSINKIFGVLIAPWAACISDRAGGRRPVILAGLAVAAAMLALLPGCGSLASVIAVVVIFQAAVDFGYTGPWRPLHFDIVPKEQRGRSMVINRYLSIAMRFVFMFFLIGSFDITIGDKLPPSLMKKDMFASLTGEQAIYYLGAAGIAVAFFFVLFGIRESKALPRKGGRGSLKGYFTALFTDRKVQLSALLVVCYTLMSTQLMTLRPLLITEQFGYSKQVMGNIHAATMLTNTLLILPLILLFIDKVDRIRMFVGCIVLSTLHPLVFWLYVKFVAPGQIPGEAAIIAFNVADSIFDKTAFLLLWPIVFDLTDPARKGFTNSAALTAAGIAGFININLLGLVVKWYSARFCADGVYDYMSTYLYIFAAGILATIGTVFFLRRKDAVFGDANA